MKYENNNNKLIIKNLWIKIKREKVKERKKIIIFYFYINAYTKNVLEGPQ